MALPVLISPRDIDILRHTRDTARRLALRLAPPTKAHLSLYSLHELVLPPPKPLASQLIAAGVQEAHAHFMSSALQRAASHLSQSFITTYESRRQALEANVHHLQDPGVLSKIPSTFSALYSKTVQNWTSYLLNELAPRILRAQRERSRVRSASPPRNKRPFNQNAIPSLERFFDNNAFPSRLEKFELATQCQMDYRQIHVWFQNRRSRFKKECKTLRRPTNEGRLLLLQVLETSIVDELLPIRPEDEVGFADDSPISAPPACVPPPSAFSWTSPAHAFPSPYPPVCPYDPFPVSSPKRRALLTPWLRIAQTAPTAHAPSDLAEVIENFAHLTLDDDDAPGQAARPRASEPPSSLCFLGFTTVCPPAPHPAFVRKGRRWPRPLCGDREPNVRQPFSRPSSPTSLRRLYRENSSPDVSSGLTKRSLPRRVPRHPPKHRRDCTPSSPGRPIATSPTPSLRSVSTKSNVDTPLATPQSSPRGSSPLDVDVPATKLPMTTFSPLYVDHHALDYFIGDTVGLQVNFASHSLVPITQVS